MKEAFKRIFLGTKESEEIGRKYLTYFGLIILAAIYVRFAIVNNPDSDAAFLITTGRYILENGFPKTNPWTFAEGFKIIIQQPICTVLNALAYDLGGVSGLVVLTCAEALLFNLSLYHLTGVLCEDKTKRIIMLFAVSPVLFLFTNTRPYLLTASVMLLEVAALQRYVASSRTRKDKAILTMKLSAFALWQANYQSASLLFLGLFLLAFAVPAVWNLKETFDWKESLYLLLNIPVMFAFSLLNPYGLDGSLYLYYSYGAATKGNYITELKRPYFLSFPGTYAVLAVVFLTIYIVLRCKEERKFKGIEPVAIYLTLGSLICTAYHVRNMWMLAVALPFLMAHILPVPRFKVRSNALQVIGSVLVIAVAAGAIVTEGITKENSAGKSVISMQESSEEIVEYIRGDYEGDIADVKLFCDFNIGAALELAGIKVYIDPRPELYQAKINGKEDVYTEYLKVHSGITDFRKFLEKYHFDYIYAGHNSYLVWYLGTCDQYEEVKTNSWGILYARLDN